MLFFSALRSSTAQAGAVRLAQSAQSPSAEEADKQDDVGFSIPRAKIEQREALVDFNRQIDKRSWEKALGLVSQMLPANQRSLVPTEGGLYLPLEQVLWRKFTDLPAAGRDAFALFFDGKAKSLLEPVSNPRMRGTAKEREALEKVFRYYFMSSLGDQAADRLAQLHFEQGRFRKAVRCWDAVLKYHPQTELSGKRLQVKRLVALLRAGQFRRFNRGRQAVAQRYADETIRIGGKPVNVADYLADLAEHQRRDSATAKDDAQRPEQTKAQPARLPASGTPIAWRMRFLTEPATAKLHAALESNNYYAQRSQLDSAIPDSVRDAQRIYVNWLGVIFAVDAHTGKLAWRSKAFTKISDKFKQIVQGSSVDVGRFHITKAEDTVVASFLPGDRLRNYRARYRVAAYDAKTGKPRWDSRRLEENKLNNADFAGSPVIVGDSVLAITHPQESSQATLRALALSNGSQRWALTLGQAQKIRNYRGRQVMPSPRLLVHDRMVYVLTNNGALIAVDLERKQMAWAKKFQPPPGTGTNNSGLVTPNSANAGGSSILHLVDGLLLFKERGASTLRAIDPQTQEMRWHRPIGGAASSIEVAERLYVLNRAEINAFGTEDRRMLWSTNLPPGSRPLNLLTTSNRILAMTNRGIFAFNKKDGDRAGKFRGDKLEQVGGRLMNTDDFLITLTNNAITAYPQGRKRAEGENGKGAKDADQQTRP